MASPWQFNPFTATLDLASSGSSSGLSGLVSTGVLFATSGTTAATDTSNFYFNNATDEVGVGSRIIFPTTGLAAATTTYTIGRDNTATNNLYYNVPSTAAHVWQVGGTNRMNLDDTNGFRYVRASGAIVYFTNTASLASPSAAQIYVQPNGSTTGSFLYHGSGLGGVGSYTAGTDFAVYSSATARIYITTFGRFAFTSSAASSGVYQGVTFDISPANNSGQGAGTEQSVFSLNSSTQTFNTGAITLQRFARFNANTIAFAGASTVTDCINVDISDVVAGANATMTRGFALRTGNSWLNGSQRVKTTASAAGNYTVLLSDYIIRKTGITAGGDTVTLPSAVTASGYTYIVKDAAGGAGANNITINTTAGNIDGAASVLINVNYASLSFYSDGTNWFII